MVSQQTAEQVLWMADCYSLAKKFPNPHTWLSLLEPVEPVKAKETKWKPFHYWLWMEIWKAAQEDEPERETASNKREPAKKK